MTNSTDTYWEVDGQSLQTYARNITTWGGSARGTPPLRGSNVLIPGRVGRRWVPKIADERTIEFECWVIGADEDGEPGDQALFRRNWAALVDLFYTPRREVALTKRWHDEDGTLVSAVGHGQVLDSLYPVMSTPTRATFTVPIRMADPLFYGDEVVIPTNVEEAVLYGEGPYGEGEYGGKALQVTPLVIPGQEISEHVQVVWHGPLTASRIWFNDQWVEVSSVAEGHSVEFDANEYTAWDYADTDPTTRTNVLGRISHGSGAPWLKIVPGEHDVVMTAQAGTGTADFKYRPAYVI